MLLVVFLSHLAKYNTAQRTIGHLVLGSLGHQDPVSSLRAVNFPGILSVLDLNNQDATTVLTQPVLSNFTILYILAVYMHRCLHFVMLRPDLTLCDVFVICAQFPSTLVSKNQIVQKKRKEKGLVIFK